MSEREGSTEPLTWPEIEAWRDLFAAVRTWLEKDTIAAAERVSRRALRAYRTPIPPPRPEAQARLFLDLIHLCERVVGRSLPVRAASAFAMDAVLDDCAAAVETHARTLAPPVQPDTAPEPPWWAQ